MFSKSILLLSSIFIITVHAMILNNREIKVNKHVVAPTSSIQNISIKKVVLKQKEIKKKVVKEVKKIKKPKVVQKQVKKIVKNAKRKIIKQKEIKKVAKNKPKIIEKKVEKLVKKEQKRVLPALTKKLDKPKKKAISTALKDKILNKYLTQVRTEIEKNKIYPKRAKRLRQQGRVVLSFIISKDGKIQNINLKNASKYKRLNKAALKILENIAKFKPIPKELGKTSWAIEVPINYSILNA